VGERVARGQGGRRRAGRRAYRRAKGVLGVLLQVGAFNVENASRCIYIYIYIYIVYMCVAINMNKIMPDHFIVNAEQRSK
jgi:hypothetical protein